MTTTAEEIANEQTIPTPEDAKVTNISEFLREEGDTEKEDSEQTQDERAKILSEAAGEKDNSLESQSYEIAAKALTMAIDGGYKLIIPFYVRVKHDIRLGTRDINTLSFSKAEFSQVQNAWEAVLAHYKVLGNTNPALQLLIAIGVATAARFDMVGGMIELQKQKDKNNALKSELDNLQAEVDRMRKEREKEQQPTKPKAKVIQIYEAEETDEPDKEETKESPPIKPNRPAAKKRGPKPKA